MSDALTRSPLHGPARPQNCVHTFRPQNRVHVLHNYTINFRRIHLSIPIKSFKSKTKTFQSQPCLQMLFYEVAFFVKMI